jgi:hypothetical protein
MLLYPGKIDFHAARSVLTNSFTLSLNISLSTLRSSGEYRQRVQILIANAVIIEIDLFIPGMMMWLLLLRIMACAFASFCVLEPVERRSMSFYLRIAGV